MRWIYKGFVGICCTVAMLALYTVFQSPGMVIEMMNSQLSYDEQHSENKHIFDDTSEKVNILNLYLKHRKHDMLHMEKPSYLPQFKNPCFYEDVLNKKRKIRKRLRCLPYYMIIGFGKSGTSNIFGSLATHPDVIKPTMKELAYWTKCRHCETDPTTFRKRCRLCDDAKKPVSWTEYLDSFDKIASHLASYNRTSRVPPLITGEGSPATMYGYAWWEVFSDYVTDGELPPLLNAHYIKHFLPNIKMIITVRDPAERMYSDYARLCRSNDMKESPEMFHRIVLDEIEIFNNCTRFYTNRYCTYEHTGSSIHRGIFVVFIRDWFKVFPRNQFYISQVEYYGKHKQEVVEEMFRFLELREVNVTQKTEYIAKPKKTMMENTRKLLRQFYKPFNAELMELLQDMRFTWDY